MKKVIVSTTINPPTEAVEKFDNMPDWHLIMIGDKKTPTEYTLKNGEYISADDQEKIDQKLSDLIGWNCIQRRNFGFLVAQKYNPDIVAVIDDDNIPYEHWGQNVSVGKEIEVNFYTTSLPAFDPVGATNTTHIWHRGFPLELLTDREYTSLSKKKIRVDIQADFWNGDPDIDAICRMEHRPDVVFDDNFFPIASNALSPFNSQNTFISGKMLKDYFLFPHIGRMDDIWAAYYVEALGYKVIYEKASVFQKRNPHNLIKDMQAEYMGYENNLQIVKTIKDHPSKMLSFLPEKSVAAFTAYQKHFE